MANDNEKVLGMELADQLPEGWVALEAVVLLKCLDEKGEPDIFMTATPKLATVDALGLATAAAFRMNAGMNGLLDDDDYADDDDEDDQQ
jgi:hypothetical protein